MEPSQERTVQASRLCAALPIECTTVRLREWIPADVDRHHDLNGLDAAWRKTNAPYFPQPSQAEIDAFPAKHLSRLQQGHTTRGGRSAAVADAATNQLIGEVTWSLQCPHTHWPSIGIVLLDEATWGQGRGFEALGSWTQLLFEVHDFHRMDARTWSGNHGMCRLAAKLGFSEEARFREARPVDGHRYDSVAYGVLRREWDARYPEGFGASLR